MNRREFSASIAAAAGVLGVEACASAAEPNNSQFGTNQSDEYFKKVLPIFEKQLWAFVDLGATTYTGRKPDLAGYIITNPTDCIAAYKERRDPNQELWYNKLQTRLKQALLMKNDEGKPTLDPIDDDDSDFSFFYNNFYMCGNITGRIAARLAHKKESIDKDILIVTVDHFDAAMSEVNGRVNKQNSNKAFAC